MKNSKALIQAMGLIDDVVMITQAHPLDEPGPIITYVSPAFERLTGYDAGHAVGRSPRFLQGPGTDRATLDRVRQSLERAEPVKVQVLNYRRDGTEFWIDLAIYPSPDAAGHCREFVAVLHDITEQKQIETALRQSETKFRAVAEMLPMSIAITRWSDGRILYANPCLARFYGIDPALITQHSIATLYPEFFERQHHLAQLMEQGSTDGLEIPWHRADGTLAVTQLAVRRIRYGDEDALLTVGIDITERKHMEETLRQSEERLQLALQAAAAGIFEWDLSTNRIFWSEESYRIFGVDPGEQPPSQTVWRARVHPDDLEQVEAAWRDAINRTQPHFDLEYRIVHPDQSIRWVSSSGRVHYDAQGAPLRVYGLNIDITQAKWTEAALRAARDKAEQANTAKTRFLAFASHDLRQPVQSLFLSAGALRQHVPTETGQSTLTKLEEGLEALKSLLDGLFDLTQIDTGYIKVTETVFPLRPLLEQLQQSYGHAASAKGVEFQISPACFGVTVRSDRTQLMRMLQNLVENAVRYTESGWVRVTCHPIGPQVRIQVLDTGVGIPADHLDRIFEELHQVGNPGRDRTQGLGLGLAIVRRLSSLLDHPVQVRSELGKGTVFSIDVPRAEDADDAPLPTLMPPHAVPRTGAPTGLAVLIEDDPIILMGLEDMFKEWGYDVLPARSTEQALEQLRISGNRVPAIVVADYSLGRNQIGTEAIRQIRDLLGQNVPGIILTGEIASECREDAAAQDLDIVLKPVTPRQLRAALRRRIG